jgi:hypothetical protein
VFKLFQYHYDNVLTKRGYWTPFFWAKEKGDTFRIARLPNLGFAQTNNKYEELLLVNDVAEQSDNYKRVYVRASQEFVRFDVQKSCHFVLCQMIYI